MISVVSDEAAQAELQGLELDELFREGARRMLAVALEAEALLCLLDYPAESRWRAVNGPHLVARASGGRFGKGRLIERPKEMAIEQTDEVAA